MPYIGRGISQLQTIDKLDAITPSTSTGAGPYNLTQSSSAFTPISANNLLISINGVVQYGNFTVSGSTVTFTGALSDSDTCNFILHVGEGIVNTPGAGTVTGASIASTFDISSKTVTLPTGVGGTSWQAVKTSDFTAVAGEGYFIDTSGNTVTATLPSSASIGNEISIIDYAGTADTNNITIGRNSHKIQGAASNMTVSTERAAFTLVYVDATQGWLLRDK